MPAPSPTANAILRSSTLSFSILLRTEPKPAAIWAVGPSRPPLPPLPIVMAAVTALSKGIRARMFPFLL